MRIKNLRLGIPLLLAIAVIAGCGQKSGEISRSITQPGGTSTGEAAMEEAAVGGSMAEVPDLVEDGLAESDMTTTLDGGVAAAPSALIRPLNFWRRIDHVERRFEIAFADTDTTGRPTTAFVTVHKRLTGSFNILAGGPPPTLAETPTTGPRDSGLVVIHKPLADHWERRLVLKRLPPLPGDRERAREPHRGWRVAATSGVEVTSKGATTEILSLRIESGPLDTTIADPLALFRLRRVLKFERGAEIKLTATTGRNDDVVLMYLRGMRLRFVNNGDNTYTGVFRSAWMAGVNHFGVNALSHGTLFDDAAPYDSQAWILPYVVVPTDLAEFMP